MTWPTTPGPTNYQHPYPNYQLNDLHQAMDYNSAGEPLIRVATYPGATDISTTDAFGRARSAQPFTLFDSAFIGADNGKFDTATTGGASTSFSSYASAFNMTVGTASGDQVVRQSYKVFPCQPGKALEVFNTFVMAAPQTNLRQRVGYFTNYNGIYLEQDGSTVNLVIRQQTGASSYTEERVAQADWNGDPMNGSGPSGITLDLTKSQIFYTTIEWLGVGSVRVGFVINGTFIVCHTFNHANVAGNTNTYMTTATLPLSYRIHNSSSIASSGTLKEIASTIISEGGYEPKGPIYTGGAGITGVLSTTSETLFAAIRMASGCTDNVIMPAQVDVAVDGNAIAKWRLYLNPTVSGVWTAAENGRGNVEVMKTGTFSGGTIIGTGLLSGQSNTAFAPESALALSLGKDANGNSDVLMLTVQCETAMKTTGQLGWRELY